MKLVEVTTTWFDECPFACEITAIHKAGRGDWAAPEDVDALEPSSDMHTTAVTEGGKLLGFGVHYNVPQWRCEFLLLLFVKPEYRRRGIGKLIIDRCREVAKTNGHSNVKLGTNPSNEVMHAVMASAGASKFAVYYQLPV